MNPPDSVAKKFRPGALALLALVLLAYLPVFRAGFIWDDDDYVTQNLTLRSAEGLQAIWFKVGATPQYYPLVHTTFWLEHHLWGLAPLGYHLVNVLLHAVAAILLWRLLERLRLPGAWLAAALWAVHPINAESVAWVTERKNVLCAVFYFAAALAWVKFSGLEASGEGAADKKPLKGGKGKAKPGPAPFELKGWLFAFGLFACAMLSKTVACSLPAALLLLIWWKRGKITVRDVAPLLPFFVMGLGLGLLTAHVEKTTVGAVGADWDLSFAQRVLIAGRALCFYVGKILWPTDFVFIYPRWVVTAGMAWQWLFPLAAGVIVAGLWLQRGRLGRGPLVAVLLYAGILFPALGFVNTYPMLYSFVADHFQYLAGVSAFVLLAVGLHQLTNGARYVLVLPVVLAVLTWQQAHIYRDLETLWRDTVTKNPACWMAWNNLGLVMQHQGDGRGAEAHYRKSLELRPGYTEAINNLAALHIEQGNPGESIAALEAALKANPDRPDVMINYGTILLQQNRTNEAMAMFEKALQLEPHNADALNNYATMLAGAQRYREAVEKFQDALRGKPEDPTLMLNLAAALQKSGDLPAAEAQLLQVLKLQPSARAERDYAQFLVLSGRVDEAMVHYQKLLQLEPREAEAHYNLACLYQSKGQGDAAFAEYAKAVDCRPDYAEAHNNWGTLLASQGKYTEALPHLEKAVALQPDYFRAHGNLGFVLAAMGRKEEAVKHLRRALEIRPDFEQARNQLRALGSE